MTYVQDDSATDFWFDNSTVERAQRRCFAWPRSTSEPSPLTTRLVTRPSISASCMTTPDQPSSTQVALAELCAGKVLVVEASARRQAKPHRTRNPELCRDPIESDLRLFRRLSRLDNTHPQAHSCR